MLITIPKPEQVDRRLLESFNTIRFARRRGHRMREELRASNLPICPRKYHIYRRLPLHKRPFEDDTFIRDSSTLEGTALHLALQKWFGIVLRQHAYGNWGCPECKKRKQHRLGIQTCDKCGKEMMYFEYVVKRTKNVPFDGHIDMIVRYPNTNFLIDFKGSSIDKIKDYKENGCKYEHYLQVNGYAGAINLGGQEVGPNLTKIDKIVIIYVDRGKPWWQWWPVQMPVSKRVYRETCALIRKSRQSLKTMVVPRGLCSSSLETNAKWCAAKDLCFDPLLETKLDDKIYPIDKRPQDRRLERRIEKRSKHDEAER